MIRYIRVLTWVLTRIICRSWMSRIAIRSLEIHQVAIQEMYQVVIQEIHQVTIQAQEIYQVAFHSLEMYQQTIRVMYQETIL